MHHGPPSSKRRTDSPPQTPEIHQSHLKPIRHHLFPKDETRVSKTRVLVLYHQGQNQEKLILVLLTLDQHSLAQPSTAQYHCCGPAHTDLRMLSWTPGCLYRPQCAGANPRILAHTALDPFYPPTQCLAYFIYKTGQNL